jgi:hypothetical protein
MSSATVLVPHLFQAFVKMTEKAQSCKSRMKQHTFRPDINGIDFAL